MIGLIIAVLRGYEIVIVIRALLSWFNLQPEHPLYRFIVEATEPLLRPLRRWTVIAGLDLSPVAAIVGIEIIISFFGKLY